MSLRVITCLVITVLVLTSVVLPAQAQRADGAREKQALALFEKSLVAYRAGRFEEAIELLTRAYQLEPEPILLYNLGRAHEGLGDLERAIESYAAYLASAPDAPDRLAMQTRIATLRDTLAERERLEGERRAAMARAEGEAARRREADRRHKEQISVAPWVVAATGVVGVGVGASLGVVSVNRRSDAAEAPTQEQAAEQLDDARRMALGANVAFAIGGALAVGGTIWGLVDLRRARRARAEARERGSMTLVPSGAGAALVVTF